MAPRSSASSAVKAFVFALGFSAVADAQVVRGTVSDAGTNAPVAGAVVLLLDSAGAIIARSLTDADGDYRLAARRSGTFRVRTLRIGFRPSMSAHFSLSSGQEMTHKLQVAGVPVMFDTVTVAGRNACQIRPDSAAAVFAVLEQARTAISATQLSAARRYGATVVRYRRLQSLRGRVQEQLVELDNGYTTRAWVSIPAEDLHRDGYVVTDPLGWVTYYAPDLDVLLSDTFAGDHCFRLASGADAKLLGIEFEPHRERRGITEIRGTLWLDRQSAQLRRLEFRYTNLSRAQEEADAGGAMDFVRLADGAWLISSWSILMPLMERRAVSSNQLQASGHWEIVVTAIRVEGGELALLTRGNDTLWTRPPLTLAGAVVDSATSQPVAGGSVELRGTGLAGTTDAQGGFVVHNVLPGSYIADVRTPSLNQIGLVHSVPVSFTDSSVRLDVRVPTADQVASQLCGAVPGVILAGSVRFRADSAAPRDARVVAHWTEFEVRSNEVWRRPRRLEARVGDGGVFHICGLPSRTSLVVQANTDSASSTEVHLAGSDRYATADLILDRGVILAERVVVPDPALAAPINRDTTTRRTDRFGYAVSRADLDNIAASRLSDVVARAPGARVVNGAANKAWLGSTRSSRSITPTQRCPELEGGGGQDADKAYEGGGCRCFAQVYLNEAIMYGGGTDGVVPDINRIPLSSVESIEYYAGGAQAPARYSRFNADCGVLVIRMRKGE